MKYSIAIIVVCILALTQAEVKNEKLRTMIGKVLKVSFAHKTNCIAESGVAQDAVDKFWNHEYSGENDRNLKCYIKCAFIKTNIIDEKGVLLVDHLLKENGVIHQLILSHPEIFTTVIAACKNPKSIDICDAAYELTQCGFEKVMELL